MKKIEDIFRVKENYRQIVAEGKPWTDPHFSQSTLSDRGISSNCSWRRASEIFHNKEKIWQSFSSDDIIQGVLGDCYLLSAVSAFSEFPGRVQRLFLLTEKNAAGCYAVRLHISGMPMEIVLDDYFAVESDGQLLFAGSMHGELWAMLIEKAWAKIHGGYAAIEGGDAREPLNALTGAPVDFYKHNEMNVEKLWRVVSEADNANYVMCTGATADSQGIVRSHAYTLINAYELKDKNTRLVQIRNPWGYGEWTGEWNDNDPRWTAELKRKYNHAPKEDGIFFMSIEDFAKFFSHTLVAKVNDSYVSSSLMTKGQKAFAAFRVRSPVKGFVSAYQISRRLGSTIIKDYNVERLRLSIYRLTEETLTLVKDCWSNPVGQAHIEVELEPDVYVLKGEFDFKSKLPCIVFNSYAQHRVAFCELKIKHLKDVTMKKAQEALEKVRSAYSASRHRKRYEGAFRECFEGHPLKWSAQAGKAALIFTCENCKANGDAENGRWNCENCRYDICSKCRPRMYGDRHNATGNEIAKIKCEMEHDMKFLTVGMKRDIYLCCSCGKAYYGTVARWRCEPCDIDLCRGCIAAPHGFRSENEPLEIDVCSENHILEFLETDTRLGTYDCSLCSKMGSARDGRWGCAKCDISICSVCKPDGPIRRRFTMVKTMTIVCDRGHILMFGCRPPTSPITCKKCERRIVSDIWRWYCKACDFNICNACRPEPQGRRDLLCSRYHKLVYSNSVQGKVTYGRCHRCHKVLKLSDGRYCCYGCEYECCNGCAELAKRLRVDDSAGVEKASKKSWLNGDLLEETTAAGSEKETRRDSDCGCVTF